MSEYVKYFPEPFLDDLISNRKKKVSILQNFSLFLIL